MTQRCIYHSESEMFKDLGSSNFKILDTLLIVDFWGSLALVECSAAAENPKDTIKENATASTAGDRPKGRVVGILKRNWREYCGTLRPLQAERQREAGPEVYNKSDRVFIPTEA